MISLSFDPMTVAALACGVIGTGLLRLNWRRRSALKPLGLGLAWLCLGGCVLLWSAAEGPEFGTAFALAWIAVVAWCLIAAGSDVRPGAGSAAGRLTATTSSPARKLLTFLTAGPLAAIASCQLTLLACLHLPVERVNAMALAALMFPVLWGLLSYWSCYKNRPVRSAALFIVTGGFATATLYL